jgi:LPLT family lysophospholipid transporter-like MFS transporter
MKRSVYTLLIAQFLTAFADNAILFAAIAMVLHAAVGGWYVPALQSAFLVAFVVLAPWVGRFADRRSKSGVLIVGNVLKALGTVLMLVGVDPLIAYGLVGVGAAVYSPAKYGVLPELVPEDQLVKANSWIEASTITAIILGPLVGARIADHSVSWALVFVIGCYVLSAIVTCWMPRLPARGGTGGPALRGFMTATHDFFATARARFSMLGAGLFWGAAAALRVLLVAWAPLVLATHTAAEISNLTPFLAVGTIVGAIMVPRLIPIDHLRRARLAAYCMGGFVLLLSAVGSAWGARLMLLAIGVCGGLFIVPINAALQEIGHKSIGSGGAVAVQQFFENFAMLMAVGLYAFAAAMGAQPVASLAVLGILILGATFLVSWHLPRDPADVLQPLAVEADDPR